MKTKKEMKAEMLTRAKDQLKDREEAKKIIQEELMEQLEGSGFWSELQELIAQSKPSVQVMAKFESPKRGKKREKVIEIPEDEFVKEHESLVKELSKHKDTMKEANEQAEELTKVKRSRGRPKAAAAKGKKKSNKVKERGLLVKQIMKERGVSLAQASKIIREEELL